MSPRWELWTYRFLTIMGGSLLIAGAYCYFAPPLGAGLEVADTEREFSDSVPGQTRAVVFALNNHSGQPIRILNLAGC